MTEETLKQLGNCLANPIRGLKEIDQKRMSDLKNAIGGLPDLGERLRRIEERLDQILTILKQGIYHAPAGAGRER